MARGKVRARIVELMAPVIAEAQMSRTEWLQWLTKCCRFDPRKFFDATGKPRPITASFALRIRPNKEKPDP
jgi:hypothetical protein